MFPTSPYLNHLSVYEHHMTIIFILSLIVKHFRNLYTQRVIKALSKLAFIKAPVPSVGVFRPSNKEIVKGCPTAYRVQLQNLFTRCTRPDLQLDTCPLTISYGTPFVCRSLIVCYAITVSIYERSESRFLFFGIASTAYVITRNKKDQGNP